MPSPELDDPLHLLSLVANELERQRTNARDVVAITFMDDGARIVISTRVQPLADLFGPAGILDDNGRTCRDEGIAVEQLRRNTFFRGPGESGSRRPPRPYECLHMPVPGSLNS